MRITFNSRRFWKILSVFAIIDACLLMVACQQWEDTAIGIIKLLGPALQSLFAILASLGVAVPASFMDKYTSWSNQTQAALLTIKGLLLQIKTAVASAQAGLINSIQAAFGVIQSSLDEILPELHITNPEAQAQVKLAFEAIAGFIAALVALLPSVKVTLAKHEAEAIHAKALKAAADFKSQFNSAVSYFGPQYTI